MHDNLYASRAEPSAGTWQLSGVGNTCLTAAEAALTAGGRKLLAGLPPPRFTYFQPVVTVSKGGYEGGTIDPPRLDIINEPAEYIPMKVGPFLDTRACCAVVWLTVEYWIRTAGTISNCRLLQCVKMARRQVESRVHWRNTPCLLVGSIQIPHVTAPMMWASNWTIYRL